MAASLCCTLLFIGLFKFVFADQKNITTEPGQNATLPCQAPNSHITAVKWSRSDLGREHVLLYRDGRFDPVNQHPSFKNRVDLQDGQMKDGNVSLILKNVTSNDTGTYECQVFRRMQDSLKLIIQLSVVPQSEQKNITVESRQNVTLPCRAPNNNNIIVVEWSRADLGDKYVLLYRDEQSDPEKQHPSFKNRVDLQDRQMKDGDVSLLLKDVTLDDTGTYECRVKMGTNQRKRAHLKTEPISIIQLSVVPPGQTGGDTEDGAVGLVVGLSVSAVLLVAVIVVGFLYFKKHKLSSASCEEAAL